MNTPRAGRTPTTTNTPRARPRPQGRTEFGHRPPQPFKPHRPPSASTKGTRPESEEGGNGKRPRRRVPWLVILTLSVIAVILVLDLIGGGDSGRVVASSYAVLTAGAQAYTMIGNIRQGRWGVDLLALVAIIATIVTGEYYASLVVVLMVAGGQALDDFASTRAQTQLKALLEGAPRIAHRLPEDTGHPDRTPPHGPALARGEVVDLFLDDVHVGDLLLVRTAETVPADGMLISAAASLDESKLTGEGLPVDYTEGAHILSGSLNNSEAFILRATATPARSQYTQIIALVTEAAASRSPTVRLADRFALPFTVFALALAFIAWLASSDPTRAAAVLVAATPCPLLIAAPVAFLGGISRAAGAGIIIRSTQSLELLARTRSAALDKTGTLTSGTPTVGAIVPAQFPSQPALAVDPGPELSGDSAPGPTSREDELLLLAACAEQYSTHVLAAAIAGEAHRRGLTLRAASSAHEYATNGVEAHMDGRTILVGKRRFIEAAAGPIPEIVLSPGETAVYVGIDGRFAGHICLRDTLRRDARKSIADLATLGVARVLMITGDEEPTARHIALQAGIDEIHANCLPADKVTIVQEIGDRPVVMVGDGVNDAPVLAAADVGIAMGAKGSTAASESADIVITVDDLAKVIDAITIGKHTLRIALQSIWAGVIMSVLLMLSAAAGLVPPLAGAFGQEAIDLLTILYALRATRLRTSTRTSDLGPRTRR